jgi:hypothetical protein
VKIEFDPAKSARNAKERGLSFELVADLDWNAAIKASGRGYNARVEQALRAAGFGAKPDRHPSSGTAKSAAAEKKRRAASQGVGRRRGSG